MPPVEAVTSADGSMLTERTRTLMGTTCRVAVWHDAREGARAEMAATAALDEMARVEVLLSRFRADSDVSRFNAGVASGRLPTDGSPLFTHALSRARRLRHLTDGAFDAEGGGALDLGGIGKGVAADLAAGVLRRQGLRNFLVDAGGDLFVSGRREREPWMVVLPEPGREATLALLALEDCAVATSGTEARGEHVRRLDPVGGRDSCLQACVVGPRAGMADALATALLASGAGPGATFLRRFPGYEALLLTAGDDVHWTPGFERHVRPVTGRFAEML